MSALLQPRAGPTTLRRPLSSGSIGTPSSPPSFAPGRHETLETLESTMAAIRCLPSPYDLARPTESAGAWWRPVRLGAAAALSGRFERVALDTIGLHYPNTSGWCGAGISCDGAVNVSYRNVTGRHLKTPGYFSRCYGV